MLRVGLGGITGTRITTVGLGVSVGGGGGQPQPFVGPYDAIPSIAALYAMRRALSDYTGPILRLRRDSDNTEQDIGYTASGDLDTAALASWLGEANGYITTWYDQSGNGHHATQATAAAQPAYTIAGPKFGGDDYLDTGIDALPNNQTVSAVARFSGATSIRDSVLGANAGFILRPRHDGNSHFYFSGPNVLAVPGLLTSGIMAIAGRDCYLNGVHEGTIEAGSPGGTLPSIFIGAWNNGGNPTHNSTATIYEVIISAATYTAQQIAAITDIMEAA